MYNEKLTAKEALMASKASHNAHYYCWSLAWPFRRTEYFGVESLFTLRYAERETDGRHDESANLEPAACKCPYVGGERCRNIVAV